MEFIPLSNTTTLRTELTGFFLVRLTTYTAQYRICSASAPSHSFYFDQYGTYKTFYKTSPNYWLTYKFLFCKQENSLAHAPVSNLLQKKKTVSF